MSVSQQLYEQASTWLNELDEHEALEGFIDLPGYEWVEFSRLDYGMQYIVAEVRPLKHSRAHELAFPVDALRAVRKQSYPPVTFQDPDPADAHRFSVSEYGEAGQERTPTIK